MTATGGPQCDGRDATVMNVSIATLVEDLDTSGPASTSLVRCCRRPVS
jgi:hypothetical protein